MLPSWGTVLSSCYSPHVFFDTRGSLFSSYIFFFFSLACLFNVIWKVLQIVQPPSNLSWYIICQCLSLNSNSPLAVCLGLIFFFFFENKGKFQYAAHREKPFWTVKAPRYGTTEGEFDWEPGQAAHLSSNNEVKLWTITNLGYKLYNFPFRLFQHREKTHFFAFNFMLEQSHYFVILIGTWLWKLQLNFLNKILLVRLYSPRRIAGRIVLFSRFRGRGCFLMTSNNLTECLPHIPIIN